MRNAILGLAVAAGLLWGGTAAAQDSTRSITNGRIVYQFNCAVCHGEEGVGEHPSTGFDVPPADLTTIAVRNGGVFPDDYVRRVIREGAAATVHGGQMPAWGLIFLGEFNSFTFDTARGDVERVNRRIDDLIAYLKTIQATGL